MSTADDRGSWLAMAEFMVRGCERDLPPWKREPKRSNGRLLRGLKRIRSIRGVHPKTRRWAGKG